MENFAATYAKTLLLLQVFLQKLCDFKMDEIKWQLNVMLCNFGLKSYLWLQIELALSARSILKSRVWFQTKLHSTQFNYHYILPSFSWGIFAHVTRFDQSRASENNWWIIRDDSQRGALRRVGYNQRISNKCEWNDCFIKNPSKSWKTRLWNGNKNAPKNWRVRLPYL